MSFADEIDEDRVEPKPVLGDAPPDSARVVEPVEDPITEAEAAELEKRAEGAREKSFSGSEYHTWRGRGLFGFSSGREGLWMELRTAVGAPSLARAVGGDRRSMLPDAQRILFLCYFAHTNKEARKGVDDEFATLGDFRRMARGDLFSLQEAVEAWAAEHIRGEDETELAIDLALQIFNESRVSRPEVAPKQGGRGGRASGLGE